MGTFTVTLQEAIDLSAPMGQYEAVGLDSYELFDPDYREALNDKIIAHFNEQEIAHETISMFRYAMRRKMNEVMPLFNQHYKASQIAIDPLLTVNIKNVVAGTETSHATESNSTDTTTTAAGRAVGSNTPQVRLAGHGDYASTAQDSESKTIADGKATAESDRNNATENNSSMSGYQGNPAELIWSLRQSFVNVDMMVIESLQELFMMVWDNGEDYTKENYGYGSYASFIYPFYG